MFSKIGLEFGDLGVRRNRERLIAGWLQETDFGLTGADLEEVKTKILGECKNSGDLLRILMEGMARFQKVDRWAEKTPEHVLYLNEIRRTIPDALIIHIIRDGRDVALSLDTQNWVQPFPWDRRRRLTVCGLYWQWMVETGMKAGATLGPDYLEVHFEQLIKAPHEILAKVAQFIGHDLDYDRIQQVGIGAVKAPNTSFNNKTDDNKFNPVGRWQKDFPEGELARFEALIGPFLTKLGYPLAASENDLPAMPGRWRIGALYRSYFSCRFWAKSHVHLRSI